MENDMIELIRAIAETMDPLNPSWVKFALVIGIDKDGEPKNNYGYSYDASGNPTAIVADDFVFDKPLLLYLNEKYADKNYPIKMLIQFDRNSGRYNVEFEDKDPTRWQVTPANIDRIREKLCPKLD